MAIKFLFFIWGSIVGSFLNVCIHRMPRAESIFSPRSHCVHCRKTIKWYENIPIVSYIFLKGKCSYCKKPISPRYFLVELLTAFLFVVFYAKFGITLNLLFFLIMLCGLMLATFIDFEHNLIPDTVSLGGLILGLIISPFSLGAHNTLRGLPALADSFLGGLIGGLVIYSAGLIGKMVFKKEAMGFGDVKFLAMIGTFIGWQKVLLVFFLAPFFGAGVGIFLRIKYKAETIPYGPYLSLAAIIIILWGDKILGTLFYL